MIEPTACPRCGYRLEGDVCVICAQPSPPPTAPSLPPPSRPRGFARRVGLAYLAGFVLMMGLLLTMTGGWRLATGLGVPMLAALLLLFIGRAGTGRAITATVIGGVVLVIQLMVLVISVTGLDKLFASQLPKSAGVVTGIRQPYTITAPNAEWRLRPAQQAAHDNALADRWLWNERRDAHLLVIAEDTVNDLLPLNGYVRAVVANARAKSPDYNLISDEPLSTSQGDARLIHGRGHVDGMDIEYLYGLFVDETRGFQVMGFCKADEFESLRPELLAGIRSFRLPPRAKEGLVSREPLTSVHGDDLRWQMDVPGDKWRLVYNHGATSATQTTLVEPIHGARILVIAERLPVTVGIDRLVDVVVANGRAVAPNYRLVSQEPLVMPGVQAKLLKTAATVENVEFEYLIGAFLRGREAYQVVAVVSKMEMPATAPELRKAIASFRLPPLSTK